MKICKSYADVLSTQGGWVIHLEFIGANSANSSGVSNKYYCVMRKGNDSFATITYGTIGKYRDYPISNSESVSVEQAWKKVREKISKGYKPRAPPNITYPMQDYPAPMDKVVHLEYDGHKWIATDPSGHTVSFIPNDTAQQLIQQRPMLA
jgi:hypothetical protein